MKMSKRLHHLHSALTGRDKVVQATVTETDVRGHSRAQVTIAEGMAFYLNKWIYTATSRNASEVASLGIKVFRRAGGGDGKTVFRTRCISEHEAKRLRESKHVGDWARKSAHAADEIEEITDPLHPLVALLRNPNIRENGGAFIEGLTLNGDLAGNAYINTFLGPNGWPNEMWSLQPQFVTVIPDKERFISGYLYGRSPEVADTFDAASIIHIRNPNPLGNPYIGLPPLAAAMLDAELSNNYTEHAIAMLENGVQPGLLVTGKFGEEERLRIEAKLKRERSGPSNALKSMVVSGDVTVTPWSLNEKEIAFLASQKDAREAIANIFGTSVALLTLDSAALATAEVAVSQWQLTSIVPRGRRIEDCLNEQLVPMFINMPGGDRLFVAMGEAVDDDEEQLATRVRADWMANLVPRREARLARGWDDIDEGEDVWAADTAPAPAAPFGGGFSLTQPKAEPQQLDPADKWWDAYEMQAARDVYANRRPIDKRAHNYPTTRGDMWYAGGKSCCERSPKGTKDQAGQNIVISTEAELADGLGLWFDAVFGRVRDNVTGEGLALELATDPIVLEGYSQNVTPILERLMLDGWNVGVDDLAGHLEGFGALAVPNEQLRAAIDQFAAEARESVLGTLDEKFGAVLNEGLQAGETIPELSQRIGTLFDTQAPAAAERIARTEASRSYLVARESAWAESGVVEGKEWLLSANPCPICKGINSNRKKRALKEPFVKLGERIPGTSTVNTYAPIMAPPAHPNCRCSIGAVFVE